MQYFFIKIGLKMQLDAPSDDVRKPFIIKGCIYDVRIPNWRPCKKFLLTEVKVLLPGPACHTFYDRRLII